MLPGPKCWDPGTLACAADIVFHLPVLTGLMWENPVVMFKEVQETGGFFSLSARNMDLFSMGSNPHDYYEIRSYDHLSRVEKARSMKGSPTMHVALRWMAAYSSICRPNHLFFTVVEFRQIKDGRWVACVHYSDVTRVPWRLKSPATACLFNSLFVLK